LEGICFEKVERENGLFQYNVYLQELKLTSRVIVPQEWENFEKNTFKLYYFVLEEKFKKKIRLQWIP
jgi:hypothetical protein